MNAVSRLQKKHNHMNVKVFLRQLRSPATALYRALSTRAAKGPLTILSALLLTFVGYLFVGPVPGSSDIVSASLGAGLGSLVACAIVLVVAQGMILRRNLSLSLIPPEGETVAGNAARLIILAGPLRLIPGTFLECEPLFTHPFRAPSVLRVFGSSRRERRLHLDVTLPHRGSWDVRAIRCAVRDVTGLATMSWEIPFQSAVIIAPEPIQETTLPLISSTQRPGDLVTDTLNRHGDPYDIKPYHPSDGIKKIVWKAFAKSGELLARHPEASMTPEGLVTIFVLARPEDDDVASKVTAYVRALQELRLDVVVGCEGALDRTPASDAESCKELLIDSVWDAATTDDEGLRRDTRATLDSCLQRSAPVTVRKLVVFCSGARVANTVESDRILAFATWVSSQGIEPVFCLTEPSRVTRESRPLRTRLVTRLVLDSSEDEPRVDARDYRAFLTACLHRQWEVFV